MPDLMECFPGYRIKRSRVFRYDIYGGSAGRLKPNPRVRYDAFLPRSFCGALFSVRVVKAEAA